MCFNNGYTRLWTFYVNISRGRCKILIWFQTMCDSLPVVYDCDNSSVIWYQEYGILNFDNSSVICYQ